MKSMNENSEDITLLYVEDDPIARRLADLVLTDEFPNLKIHFADNGQAGLELYKEHRPDVVVTDINMPIMDGMQMAKEIRAISSSTSIIVVTSFKSKKHQSEANSLGVEETMLKPLDYKQLCDLISKCVGKSGSA